MYKIYLIDACLMLRQCIVVLIYYVMCVEATYSIFAHNGKLTNSCPIISITLYCSAALKTTRYRSYYPKLAGSM